MLDLLKKIGVPATVAAVIASLVTTVPLLFKVDERYAKASDVTVVVAKLEKDNTDLRHELAQTIGFQQAMVALIQQGKLPANAHPTSYEYNETGGFMRVQFRGIYPSKEAASAASAPASAASAVAPKPVILRMEKSGKELEKPMNWKELSDGLMRQQQRLIKD